MDKKKIIFAVMIVVIAFLLFYITRTSYAYLKGSATSVTSVPGATWSVSLLGGSSVSLTTGNTMAQYQLTLNNNSEVDVTYSIVLSNLPTGMRVKLDSGGYVEEVNGSIEYNTVETLYYKSGGAQKKHILTFNAPLSTTEVTNQAANISVDFKQDINGYINNVYRWNNTSTWYTDTNTTGNNATNISSLTDGTDYVSSITDVTTLNALGSSFYLKHKIDYNVVKENYVVFVVTNAMVQTNPEMTAGIYELKEEVGSTAYDANKALLNSSFNYTNCSETIDSGTGATQYSCSNGSLTAIIRDNGYVGVLGGSNNGCYCAGNGGAGCY